jgi:hypothetical protein
MRLAGNASYADVFCAALYPEPAIQILPSSARIRASWLMSQEVV